tara:strand:- start:5680 stop:6000 length:321 start_codon:yes stop_codon:yes gene_type:complete
MFCPKCGSIMLPKKEGKKTIAKCSCGYSAKDNDSLTVKEEVTGVKKKIEVIEKDHTLDALPIIDAKCDQCNHEKAHFWTVQTRAADEPETKFLKCVECKHTWRDYD